ncbi:uncharacterized protein [Triticum aestivum]|uniref:uncharacterized protein n=1 Tax=Triticum aestivum TaxID=4565 RepID=UPI001D012A83|nr:uncharacterized protein LOC123066789 [Triticum aestivum]
MAAALRLAARRICGSALGPPPQAFLAAVGKVAPRRISTGNGGISLRRTFSESPQNNLVSNNAADPASLGARAEEKKQELLQILRQMDRRHCKNFDMEMENKKLVHLLARSSHPAPYSIGYFLENHWLKSTAGASLGLLALIYVEAEYVIPAIDRVCKMVKA